MTAFENEIVGHAIDRTPVNRLQRACAANSLERFAPSDQAACTQASLMSAMPAELPGGIAEEGLNARRVMKFLKPHDPAVADGHDQPHGTR